MIVAQNDLLIMQRKFCAGFAGCRGSSEGDQRGAAGQVCHGRALEEGKLRDEHDDVDDEVEDGDHDEAGGYEVKYEGGLQGWQILILIVVRWSDL